MVCPGGQKGTAISEDGVFLSNLGLVGAVAILSPSTQFKWYRYYTKLNDGQSVTYFTPLVNCARSGLDALRDLTTIWRSAPAPSIGRKPKCFMSGHLRSGDLYEEDC